MPALSTIVVFLLAGLGILLIPRPAVLYIVTRSLAQERRAGLASVGGIETANLVHLVAAALGLSALLMTSTVAFSVVKYLGTVYLNFLGVRILLTRNKNSKLSQLYANGCLVNLLSPKAALFYYAFLSQFVDPVRGAVVEQLLVLGIIFAMLASCTDSLYALMGATIGQFFRRNARLQQASRYITRSIFILLGLATAVTGSE